MYLFYFFFYFLLTIFLYSKWVEFLHLFLIISSITQTCYHPNFSRLSAKPPKGAAVNLLLSRSPNQAFSHNNPWKLFLSSYLWPHCCKIQWSLAFSPYSTTYSSDHSLSSLIYFFSFGFRVTSISCFFLLPHWLYVLDLLWWFVLSPTDSSCNISVLGP